MLSIVIPTRRKDSMAKMMASIKANTTDYEVIIVDVEGGMNAKLNWGMRMAKGDWIAMLHDDMTALPEWADEMPKKGIGAFKIGEMNDNFDCWGGADGGYCTDPVKHPNYSAFLVFSRKAYADIGPADEFYAEPGWQDTDYGNQIRKAGYNIECLSGKLVHHAERHAPLAQQNKVYFDKKWA